MDKKRIEVYADEQFNKHFLSIGCLFIPLDRKQELANNLKNMRCLYEKSKEWFWKFKDCPLNEECNENWHKLDNVEIHYTDLHGGSSAAFKKWLNFLINENKKGVVYVAY